MDGVCKGESEGQDHCKDNEEYKNQDKSLHCAFRRLCPEYVVDQGMDLVYKKHSCNYE